MPRYFVYHRVNRIFETQDSWIEDWKGLRARANGECGGPRWIRSWFAPVENELICEWEAPEVSSISGCFTSAELDMAPIIRIQEVAHLDASWLE